VVGECWVVHVGVLIQERVDPAVVVKAVLQPHTGVAQ